MAWESKTRPIAPRMTDPDQGPQGPLIKIWLSPARFSPKTWPEILPVFSQKRDTNFEDLSTGSPNRQGNDWGLGTQRFFSFRLARSSVQICLE